MTRDYRADIDALRGVSVLFVIGFHTFPNIVRGGFVGVDVFFVISGFLITNILLRDAVGDVNKIFAFYIRRLRRILPALITVLALTVATSWFILLPNEFKEVSKHLIGAATFTSNFVLWSEAGYFDAEAINKPLLHLWSLAIEEQFYLLFPILLITLERYRVTGYFLVCLAFISFASSAHITMQDADHAFYSPLTRMWELLCGALLAIYQRRTERKVAISVNVANVMSLGGAFLIAVAVISFDKTKEFPGWRALMPVAGAVLMIAAGHTSVVSRVLLNCRVFVFFGLISYPLYLWHWPLITLNLKATGELVTVIGRMAIILISIILAWLTYYFIEQPVRKQQSSRNFITIISVLSLFGLIGLAGASGALTSRLHAHELEPIMAATTDWQFPPPAFRMLIHEGHRYAELRGSRPGATLYIGDSNVQQLAVRLALLARETPEKLRTVIFATRGGCLPVRGYDSETNVCDVHLNSALRLADRPDIDRIVLGGYWLNLPEGRLRQEAIASLGELIRNLAEKKKVYLVLNIPAGPEYDPRNMFVGSRLTTLHSKKTPAGLDWDAFLLKYGVLRSDLSKTTELNGGITIDPLPILCPENYCSVVAADGRPLYMDEHHMRPFHVVATASFIDKTALDE